MDRESAISKNIILALAATVAIIIIVIIMVMVFFPPQPDVVPQFTANIERAGNVVYIYHDGGDPLQDSRTVVKINGEEIPSSEISFLHAQDWPWTPGKTMRIQYSGSGTPDLVQIIYSSGSREELIFSSQALPPQGTPIPVTTMQPPATTAATTAPAAPAATPAATTAPGQVTAPPGTVVPGAPQPPLAGFSADPRSGQLPLTVQFTDTSAGSPNSWLWNFGDGESSSEQNPGHTYKNPGSFTVTLTVGNSYGTSQKSEQDLISAGSLPEANFAVVPPEGDLPLDVQFNDLSSGNPTSWSWNFGDGSASTDRNPRHTYISAGTYTVTLTVNNEFGSNTRIQAGSVRVTEPPRVNVYLTGSRMGTLSGGYLQFMVTSPDSWVKIAGSAYPLAAGDTVQLFIDAGQSGEIDVKPDGISGFRFDSARMFVNGEFVRSGIVSDIWVRGFAGLKSTLSVTLPPGDSAYILYVDNGRILPPSGNSITIYNLGQNSDGQMNLQVKLGSLEYRGGAEGYRVG